MNKAEWYKLKKMVGCLALLISLGLTTGCSGEDSELSESYIESYEKDDRITRHDHLHITIGNQTFIFRECSDKISRIVVSDSSAASSYTVFDENNNIIISGFTTDGVNLSNVETFEQEDFIQGMEETMIEHGAVLELK